MAEEKNYEVIVKMKDIRKKFGDGPEILKGINMELRKGDIVAILFQIRKPAGFLLLLAWCFSSSTCFRI